jgi:hypothetical protein
MNPFVFNGFCVGLLRGTIRGALIVAAAYALTYYFEL